MNRLVQKLNLQTAIVYITDLKLFLANYKINLIIKDVASILHNFEYAKTEISLLHKLAYIITLSFNPLRVFLSFPEK